MATNDIGRVTPIWRGFFSAATTYELNDIVIDTAGSVWWHKSPAQTTGEIPEAGEIWDAVIDMSVFSGLIQSAIVTAQTALAAAQEAVGEVSADTERAETAAQNAETSALNAAESAASVGAQAQAAERSAEAAAGSATGAAGSAEAAAGSKSDAEAYAVGKRGGEDVETTDPTYHNNAKYYSEQAESSAEAAAQSAEDAQEVLDSIPADYSTLSGEVGNLKESVYKFTGNKKIDFTPGYYVKCTSNPVDYTGSAITASVTGFAYAIIDVLPGDKFTVSSVGGNSSRAWCFIDNDGNMKSVEAANVSVSDKVITAPEGATKLIINAKPLTDAPSYYGEFLVKQVEDVTEQVANVKEHTESNTEFVEEIKSTIIHHESTNHYNDETKVVGRLDVDDGSVDTTITTSSTTDWIPVMPGTVVRTAYVNNSDVLTAFGARFVAYTAEKEHINGVSGVASFTVPENAEYIRVGIANSYLQYPVAITFDTAISDYTYEPYFNPYNTYTEDFLTEETKRKLDEINILHDTPYINNSNTLSGSDVLRVAAPHAKRNYTISFRGKITTFGKITIGIGKASSYLSGWVEIDSTNIYVYTKRGGTEVLAGTYVHGLTFSETISVDIHATGILSCEVILSTVGGMFKTQSDWFGCLGFSFSGFEGRVTAETDGGVFTDCSIAYYCADYKKDIWGFGDSYFDHWPRIAIENNYDNFAIDGASGRHSDQAWHSLELESQKRLPKKILWCMGMNDYDTASSVNTSWKTYYDKLTAFCDAHNIELILCTIPCVPERNNSFKNQIIRDSGYRYVDIADAVGGTEPGSTWYDGLLEPNNDPALRVHPTNAGDKVIAARFMADVSELMD